MPKADQATERLPSRSGWVILRHCTRRGLLQSTALQAVATVSVLLAPMRPHAAFALPPGAQPSGGQVVAGQASIARTPSQTTVTQSSQNAALNWQSYNVGSAQTVQYIDPTSSSVTLNRVIGANPSEIAGKITSNGTVVIVNQAGLLFDRGAQINTAGLVVSAAGISNGNLMAGKMIFDQAANPGAKVENRGTISIKDHGLAALVAPQVANSGIIRAKLGTVILAGAETHTLDLYGDGMVSIDVTGQVRSAADGTKALVTNSGVVSAAGGTVVLTADAVDGVVQTLVNAGGKISANSVGAQTGRVVIAGAGGDVVVTGNVAANGHAAGTTGGAVVVNATGAVTLASGTRVTASGKAGGGVVAIGTTLARARGGPSVTATRTAASVTVQQGATIAANATVNGNGGRVTVLSTTSTDMAGNISAMGGPNGGNGGFVEVSGNQAYALTGLIDVTAPRGAIGTVLIDPANLDVIQGTVTAGNLDGSFSGGTLAANVPTSSQSGTVSNGEIQSLGSNGNVVLQTSTGTIGVHATINVPNALSLEAGTDVLVDRGVTITAGGLFLSAGSSAGTGSILLGTTGTLGPVLLSSPTVVMQAGSASAMSGINLTDTIINHGTVAATTVDLSALGGGINQSAGGVINAGTLLSSLGVTGAVTLAGTSNSIGSLGSINVTGGSFTLANTGILSVAGGLTGATNVTLNSGTIAVTGSIMPSGTLLLGAGAGGIALNTGHVLSGTVVDLSATGGGVTQVASGTISAGTLQSSSGVTGNVSLTGTLNQIASVGSFAVTSGNFSLTDSRSLTIVGTVTAGAVAATPNAANTDAISLTTSNGAINIGVAGGVAGMLNAGTVYLNTGGSASTNTISEPNGSIIANLLTAAAGGTVMLNNPGNDISAIGGITAANGDVVLVVDGPDPTVLYGPYAGNNLFFEEAVHGGTLTLGLAAAGTVQAIGATMTAAAATDPRISFVADYITEAPGASNSLTATHGDGTVEIAPYSSTIGVTVGGTVTPNYDQGLLNLVATGPGMSNVVIGQFTDVPNGGTISAMTGSLLVAGSVIVPNITLNAGTIGISGTLSATGTIALGASAGGIQEAASAVVAAAMLESIAVNAGTLQTPGTIVGGLTLAGTANAIGTLANVGITGGDLIVLDHTATATGTLAVPGGVDVFANDVTITNWGSIVLAGSVGACVTPGAMIITAIDGDITVDSPAVIGAIGSATFAAPNGNFTQNGGLVNAKDVTVTAGGSVTQNGGIIAGLDTTPATVAVGITAGGGFTQSAASAVIFSNSDLSLSATSITTAGAILAVGSGALTTPGTLSQSGGIIATGNNLTLSDPSNISQSGAGTISAGATLTLFAGGLAQSASAVVAADTLDTNVNPPNPPAGSVAVVVNGTTVYCYCSFGVPSGGGSGPGGSGPPQFPAPPTPGNPALYPYYIGLTQPTISITDALEASWIYLHSTGGSTAESGNGVIITNLLTGNSFGDVTLGAANQMPPASTQVPTPSAAVLHLGTYSAVGNFTLTVASGTTLDVIGTVSVGNGHTLALTASALTVDHTGSIFTVPSVVNSTLHDDTIATAGLLSAPAAVTAGGAVTPGQILLQTDTLTLSPGTAPNGVVLLAPDGLVAVAPLTATAVDLDANGSISSAGTLVLTPAMLAAINTVGTTAGTAGTETLVLGSLDGAIPLAGTIDINTGVVLTGTGVNGIARNLVLDSAGAVQEHAGGSLSVTSLAGLAEISPIIVSGTTLATGFALANGTLTNGTLTNSNTIAEIGNVATRIVGGTTFATTGTVGGGLLNLTSGGDVRVTDAAPTLTVVGTITANAGTLLPSGTIALTSPAIQVITGNTTLATGTIVSAGSLLATGGPVVAGTLTPSEILLQADGLRIINTGPNPTAAIVSAPSGQVAIAPLTQGRTISVDATVTLGGPTLSLGTSDLALINTTGGTLSAMTPGPAGTQTLSLGSLNNGGSIEAGGITINTAVTMGGTANMTANTLALYSNGDVVETPAGASPAGAVTVNTLTGTVTGGNIYLNGTNGFANLGNLGTLGGLTTPNATNANLVATSGTEAPSGNILILNTNSLTLNVVTDVQGAAGAANYTEIDQLAGSSNNIIVLNTGTVQAGSVYLRAGNASTPGSISVGGLVTALAGTGEADLAAGVQYTSATPTSPPSSHYGPGFSAGTILISGLIDAGTVGLFAADSITEPGVIIAGLLTGFSDTSAASLPGLGAPTANRVANLGTFSTQTGFLLRDGMSLAVVGPVTDATNSVTITVAPPGSAPNAYGVGDLVLASTVTEQSATGTVDLEATGNVYETNGIGMPGTIIDSGGTFAVTGGTVIANTLFSQSGMIPDTEPTGNTPGTNRGTAIAEAIDWFGNPNQVTDIGNAAGTGVTATGNFLLTNVQDLTVLGPVLAGAQSPSVTAAAAFPVAPGFFGTTPGTTPAPFAEIDVVKSASAASGNLTIASTGVIHVGIDGTLTGNVTLRAGDSSIPGGVTIDLDGGVFAANGGTVNISAGFDPTISPAASAYFAACGGAACDITIDGTIWGDATGATRTLAGVVQLDAASAIDEPIAAAEIGATLLTGHAGWHADIGEVDPQTPATPYALASGPSINQIATLGAFASNVLQGTVTADDPLGFLLRDGRTLTVTGPVSDGGSVASQGISIAVVPSGSVAGTAYGTGDLLVQGNITAATTTGAVALQATGNVVQSAGSISAATLIAQAGAIPDTEAAGNPPGTIPATVISSSGSIILNDQNQVLALGSPTLGGVSAEGPIALTNVPTLTVNSTVISAAGTVSIVNTGDLTNNGAVSAGTNAALTAGPLLINNGLVTAGGTASLGAGEIDQFGGVTGGVAVSEVAGTAILHTGTSSAGTGGAALTAGTSITQTGGLITAANGDVGLTAGTSITQTGGTITAANGNVGLTAAISITQNSGAIATTGTLATTIALNARGTAAGTGITQAAAGLILAAGAPGTITVNAANLISLAGSVSAPDATAGTVTITAGGTQFVSGSAIAAGTALTQTGNVNGGSAVTEIATLGDIALSGTSTAGAGGLTLRSLNGSIAQTAGLIQAVNGGTIALLAQLNPNNTGSGAISQAGGTIATANGLAAMTAGTSISQTGGTIVAANGDVGLTAATSISQFGGTIATANGDVGLTAGTSISQTGGMIKAANGDVILTAGTTIGQTGGTINAARAARLTAERNLTQTAGGSIAAPQIDFFSAEGPVFVAGTLSGLLPSTQQRLNQTQFAIPGSAFPKIGAGNMGSTNGIFVTLGSASTTAKAVTFTADATATSGHPQLVVTAQNNEPMVLSVDPANSAASLTDLFLNLQTGSASGTINVSSLHVLYAMPGTTQLLTLLGTVRGETGSNAATASFIQLEPNNNYQVNGCPIESLNCIRITSLTVPVTNPLTDVLLGQLQELYDCANDYDPQNRSGGIACVLPDVARRDY